MQEAVASTPQSGAAEPVASVNIEEQGPYALHSSPELVQHPTKPTTEDPEDDVELLRRVVHNIKTLVENVLETSEVCWIMFISDQHFTGARSHSFVASALRELRLGSHVLSAQGMDNNSCPVSYTDGFSHHGRPLRSITRE